MPRSEEANARIREDQRRRILAAAERVFARKGLAAAKMSDIARARWWPEMRTNWHRCLDR